MDFGGLITIDGMINSSSIHGCDVFSSSSASKNDKRSGLLASDAEKLDWRCFKMAKSEAPPSLPNGQQLLRFYASRSEASVLSSGSKSPTSSYIGNTGLGLGKLNVNSNELSGGRGIFTSSQWMELENQALIYKYIDANVEIPTNLLIPKRTSYNPFGLSAFSSGSLRTSALDRGSYHVGLCGNADPELGRCRRTDGKKWRCSREAVADQKYCERHLNRGRHRSRKPVEGHNGQTTHIKMNLMPVISTSQAVSPSFGNSLSNSNLAIAQQEMGNMKPSSTTSSTTQLNRTTFSDMKESTCSKDSEELCKLTLLNSKGTITSFPTPKQNQIDKLPSNINFGFVSTCSSSLQLENSNNAPSLEVNDQQLQPHHVLQHFTWSEGGDMKPDNYELSIPMPPASDFFSCSSSLNGMSQRITNGVPFIWDKYAGGPLAEALKNTGKAQDHGKKSSLDLMMDNWDMSTWTGSSSTTFDSASGTTTSSSKHKLAHGISGMLSHDFD
ncbi:growth-regulating factor 7-like isoform X3 [Canna indica]|uniref:Growth-regulating factor n=1 Tax=Canna indica TaxID=4628 RepID=A0AAQ3Q8A1_9LILI|nr:growth-regulating factor 7-like isoform X3 [Canna indica]